jgi:transcriptional regulator with XRE-family HTH domain
MEKFGAYLRRLREANDLKPSEVIYQVRARWGVRISQDALAMWESGKIRRMPAVPLACLARLYGVSFDELFGALFNAQLADPAGPVPGDEPPSDTPSSVRPPRRRRGAR